MKGPEERRDEDRRRRTERQRKKRSEERICGHCRKPATAGLIEWAGRRSSLLIPICRSCLAKLGPGCGDMDGVGSWRYIDAQRPCADCSLASPAEQSGRSFLRRLFSR